MHGFRQAVPPAETAAPQPHGPDTGDRSQPWTRPVDEALRLLGSGAGGLSAAEAQVRVDETAAHVLDAHRRTGALHLLARQFLNPTLLILLGATVLAGVLGELVDATIIVAIIAVSGLLGFWHERGADRAMASLLHLVRSEVSVLRDGEPQDVPIAEVVPGDVVLVSAGDLVPGDALVLDSRQLLADESVLTGETFPAEKRAGVSAAVSRPSERSNMLFLGTHVSSGSGRLLVVSTGRETELGRVAGSLTHRRPPTGFERGMTAFGLLLTRAMALLVVAIFAVNVLLQRPFIDSALFSLALAVGLTPQLLPAIVSLSLSEGAREMARQRVIVRRLDAIEDFGSMDVLCLDKTGTVTDGEIRVSSVTDVGGAPSAMVERLAHLNAAFQVGLANPIDASILARSRVDVSGAVRLDELPYDFGRKRLSVLVTDPALGADPVLVTKGSVAAVLDVCSQVEDGHGAEVPLAARRSEIDALYTALSSEGTRVLAVASRTLAGRTNVDPVDEAGLTLHGFVSFADPVKEDGAAMVRALEDHGISVRMLTGDNRYVAAHVAAEVGLDLGGAMTGRDVAALDDLALGRAARDVRVFSELDPLHKERIVRALRRDGHVAGYLGDGINDAPALRAADVGISVDTAVTVAKQAASIVLLDKDLGVLLDGVLQGRRTFANTMKYLHVTTSANFGNMLSMAAAAVVLPFLPLLAGQILLVNLLTDLPGMTIATDAVDASALERPQQWDVRQIRRYMLVFGALSSVFDVTMFLMLRLAFHAQATEFRSAWFLGSILTEVGVLFALRTRVPIYRSRPSRLLVLSSLLTVVATVVLPFTPAASMLGLVVLPAELVGLVVAVALSYVVCTEVVKVRFWQASESAPKVTTGLSHW